MVTTTLEVPGPAGETILVPFAPGDDENLRHADLEAYYREHGYAIARGLIPERLCKQVRSAFDEEVRPHRGFLFRQTTGRPERHALTACGFMANPLINVQDLRSGVFPEFQAAALGAITHADLTSAVAALIGERGIVVQSMCFEGNPATPAHQDGYYLDSTKRGSMVAAWIAVEDIHPGAGRFFVYPGSQRLSVAENAGVNDVAFHHDRYHAAIIDAVRNGDAPCRAPALRAGDVLFWNARTIHGSLIDIVPSRSRFSLTAHYIPASGGYLQLERRVVALDLVRINGVDVHRQRPQDDLLHRATLDIAGRFPRSYSFAKRCAIRAMALRPGRRRP